MADSLLVDEVFLGINLPFIKKRMALEEQGQIEPRISILENEENEEEMDEWFLYIPSISENLTWNSRF